MAKNETNETEIDVDGLKIALFDLYETISRTQAAIQQKRAELANAQRQMMTAERPFNKVRESK